VRHCDDGFCDPEKLAEPSLGTHVKLVMAWTKEIFARQVTHFPVDELDDMFLPELLRDLDLAVETHEHETKGFEDALDLLHRVRPRVHVLAHDVHIGLRFRVILFADELVQREIKVPLSTRAE